MDLGFSVASYFVLFLTLLFILNVLKSWNKNHVKNFPPGPRCLPLIGNLHLIDLKKPHLSYLEFSKKYGTVFSVQMGMKKMVVLTGYETVKDALVNYAEEFGERGMLKIFKKMDKGMGLTLSQGENWKTMRRFTITTLRDFGMGRSSLEEKVAEECTTVIKYFATFKEKVQEEISRVLGSAQPMYSHRGQMPFTNAVIHEIQRFSDILPTGVIRETTKDVTFRGYFIPKGTFIISLLTSILKDSTQFEKPNEFYPENFLDSKGNFVKKDAFLPFSAGRRACAGETLARMELFMFFTSLLQKFTFCFPPGVNDVDLSSVGGITNAPQPHMICAVSR